MWQEISTNSQVKIHRNEKPFGCYWYSCDKKLVEVSCLNVHVKIHSDEKPFDCFLCAQEIFGTLLSEYTNMKKHLTSTHVTWNFYKFLSQNTLSWETIWLQFVVVWQEICWPITYEWTCQSSLRLKSIWLLLIWKEIFTNFQVKIQCYEKPFWCYSCDKKLPNSHVWVIVSEYTQINNHLSATHVTRNFPRSHVRIHSDQKPFGS